MQKKLFSWMTIALMAFVCVGFAACGSDDEDDNGGGSSSGSASITLDGKSLRFGYAYWNYVNDGREDPQYQITFYDYNMENYLKTQKMPETLTAFAICIRKSGDKSVLPTGTFKDFWVAISKNETAQQGKDGHTVYGVSYYGDSGKNPNAEVTVSKNGSQYTVKVTGLDIYSEGETASRKVAENVSFTYNGGIASIEELMKKYGAQ